MEIAAESPVGVELFAGSDFWPFYFSSLALTKKSRGWPPELPHRGCNFSEKLPGYPINYEDKYVSQPRKI